MENRKEKMYWNIRMIWLEYVINGMWLIICLLDLYLFMLDCMDLGFFLGELGLMWIFFFDIFSW